MLSFQQGCKKKKKKFLSTGEEAENLSKQDHNYLHEYRWKNKLLSYSQNLDELPL